MLLICGLLGVGGVLLFINQSSLNSDLGRLISPSDELLWYQSNEAFKARFPMYQQTALAVVRGPSLASAQTASRALKGAFEASSIIENAFVPSAEAFIQDHRLYYLSPEQLADWLSGAEYNYGALVRFDEQPDIANALLMAADMLSNPSGLPLPISIESLISSLTSGAPDFQGFYPLEPVNTQEFFDLVIISGQQSLDQPLPNAAIVEALNRAIDQTALPEGVTVELTGEIILANEEIQAALTGIEIAGFVSLVLLAIILGLGIKQLSIITMIFFILFAGIGMTLGFAVLAVGSFNTLSMLFVVMFFGLGIDFAVHFAMRVYAGGDHSLEALTRAIGDMGPALLLCTATSTIAFLSFLPTAYSGMGELGLICAGGMIIALTLTLTVTPAFLTLWPPGQANSAFKQPKHASSTPGTSLALGIVLLAPVALFFATKLEFNYSVLSMRDAQSPAMQALARLQAESKQTDYSIAILARDAAQAAELKSSLSELPSVGDIRTPESLVPSAQGAKMLRIKTTADLYNDLWSTDAELLEPIPLAVAIDYFEETKSQLSGDHQRQAETILAAIERLQQDPEGITWFNRLLGERYHQQKAELRALLSANAFTFDDLPKTLRDRLVNSQGEHLLMVQPATALLDRTVTDQFIGEIQSIAPQIAGRSAVEWGIGEVVVEAFQQATLFALLGVIVCLWLYFKNGLKVVLVLIPIAFTLIFTFAISYGMGITINMANILVIPLVIGLGVDAGIHVTHRFFYPATEPGLSAATQRAVLISGLTTLGTFFSLVFSPHQGAASIGLLLTLTISIMLVLSLSLLPTLLTFFDQRGYFGQTVSKPTEIMNT